jgi:hypothetical protein
LSLLTELRKRIQSSDILSNNVRAEYGTGVYSRHMVLKLSAAAGGSVRQYPAHWHFCDGIPAPGKPCINIDRLDFCMHNLVSSLLEDLK